MDRGGMEHIQSVLAAHFGRRYCVLTNRGTTALTAALHGLNRPGARALFPAVMCSIPVFSAVFAGWRTGFADVNLDDANFDLNAVEQELKKGDVGAVIPVHMFGKPDDMSALEALGRRYGADVVEDVALSMGSRRDGKPAGSFGRISCLSFVRKMLPLEMGGAVLTDDPDVARRAQTFVNALPPEVPARRDEILSAMKAFHSLTGYVAAGGWIRRELLAPFENEFRRLLLASSGPRDWSGSIILDELKKLPDILQARRARAEVYENALGEGGALVALNRTGSSLFAYPVRLRGLAAEDFLAFSANQGYTFKRIAYPDIHGIFAPGGTFPNAETVEREMVGLPLDDDQPVSAFWGYADDFRRAVEGYVQAAPTRRPMDTRGKLELRLGGVS